MDAFGFIKENVDIYSVVARFVVLKRIGGYWKGACPFHVERDASFTVSPTKGIFYCFGCHESGDATGFFAKIKGVSQSQAVILLAEEFNLKLPERLLSSLQAGGSGDDTFYRACAFFSDWTAAQLASSEQAKQYLKNRGLSSGSLERFKLGFCPDLRSLGLGQLEKAAVERGLLLKDLETTGVVSAGEDGSIWSPFSGRIIFPIRNWQGKTCGFGGRVFMSGDTRAKYYNSRDSEFFHKGRLFFGLDLARPEMQRKDSAVVVEGYLDCVMLSQSGIENCVAVLGTACSEHHIEQLSRFVKRAFFFYDGDRSGQAAILKVAKMAISSNLEVFVVLSPVSEDPASAVQQGLAVKDWIESAQPIMKFFVSSLGAEFFKASLGDRMNLVGQLLAIIHGVADPLRREFLLIEASSALQIPLAILKGGVGQKAVGPVGGDSNKSVQALTGFKLTLDWQTLLMYLADHKEGRANFVPPEDFCLVVGLEVKAFLDKMAQFCSNSCLGQCYFPLILELSEQERLFVQSGVANFSGERNRGTFDALIKRLRIDAIKNRVVVARGLTEPSEVSLKELVNQAKALREFSSNEKFGVD